MEPSNYSHLFFLLYTTITFLTLMLVANAYTFQCIA